MNDMSDPPYAVFSKDGTSKLWVRFSIKGEGQVRKSLGTSDPELARRKAHEVWYEAQYRSRNGLKSQTTSFTKAADEFIAMVEREVERGDRPAYHVRDVPPVIRRYFIEFFGKKDIDAIMERDITRYTQYAIENRDRSGLILCNVMQGRDHLEADAWFQRMSPYQRYLEGIALAGGTKQDMWFWNKRLIEMRDAGLLDRLQWIHVLGTAQPGFGVMLTGLQKAMRKHLNSDIRISYDSARAFRNVHANHIITRGLRETGSDIALWPYQFPKSASALDRSKPFPFPSPLGDRCTYGDFNPGNPNSTGGWDTTGLMMLSNHEVYKEVQAIAEANRMAEAEVTTAGGTPWHIRRSWEAFDLIWATNQPDVHLKKYRQFLTHYAGTPNDSGDDER